MARVMAMILLVKHDQTSFFFSIRFLLMKLEKAKAEIENNCYKK